MYLLFHILTSFYHGVVVSQLLATVAPAKKFVVLVCYICNANISLFDVNSELVAKKKSCVLCMHLQHCPALKLLRVICLVCARSHCEERHKAGMQARKTVTKRTKDHGRGWLS
jgi:hypothetical protein